jgi:hypothetical protein
LVQNEVHAPVSGLQLSQSAQSSFDSQQGKSSATQAPLQHFWSSLSQQFSPQGKSPASQQTPEVLLHWPGSQHSAASPVPQQSLAFGQQSPLQMKESAVGQHCPASLH